MYEAILIIAVVFFTILAFGVLLNGVISAFRLLYWWLKNKKEEWTYNS